MNAQIRKLVAGLLVLYVVLFGALNVAQVTNRDELESHPLNNRQSIRDFNRPRGAIVTADGVVVAQSVATDGSDGFEYQREYPLGDLFGNITGYYSYSFGSTQLERSMSDVLMGDTAAQTVSGLLGGSDNSGSVRLTLRADVQELAAEQLGDREGSVVVMDPNTGAVLAMVSFPRIDSSLIANHNGSEAEAALAYYDAAPGKPLLTNAYQENYMPGSAFKVITTGIALDAGITSLDRVWDVSSAWTPPDTSDPVQNYGGKACGGSMAEVFARSCNIPFAQLANELGPEAMTAGVAKWGVGEKLPIDLPGAASSSFCGNITPCDASFFAEQLPLLAIGGFGQGNDLMVPLHMCMVASTVANGGRMMRPYVIDATFDHAGKLLERTQPSIWKTPITAATAAVLNVLMQGVVNTGTGTKMQLANGVQGAAKTGTAQLNAAGEPMRSHAWIIGFAPAEQPRYAVAVMLKGTTDEVSASTGGRLAGPIAKKILDHLLSTEG